MERTGFKESTELLIKTAQNRPLLGSTRPVLMPSSLDIDVLSWPFMSCREARGVNVSAVETNLLEYETRKCSVLSKVGTTHIQLYCDHILNLTKQFCCLSSGGLCPYLTKVMGYRSP